MYIHTTADSIADRLADSMTYLVDDMKSCSLLSDGVDLSY